MFDKMKEKLDQSINCWITTKYTTLLEDNFLGLGYQLVKCDVSWKQYVVFRTNWNTLLEEYTKDLEIKLNGLLFEIEEYKKWIAEMKKRDIQIYSNIKELIEYPLWTEDHIVIKWIQDLIYWTEKILDMTLFDAMEYLK